MRALLELTWRRLPDTPGAALGSAWGAQDSGGGVLYSNGTAHLVVAFGNHALAHGGMLTGGYYLPMDGRAADGWRALPRSPYTAPDPDGEHGRSVVGSAAVNASSVLFVGGFDHEETFRSAALLTLRGSGDFDWSPLPPFPHAIAKAGVAAAANGTAYVHGGCALVGERCAWRSASRALWAIDLGGGPPAWRRLPDCPGTPRMSHAAAVLGGALYVVGGAVGSDDGRYTPYNVVDNWRFDLARRAWAPIAPLPVSSGVFQAATFAGRYMVMPGGVQYSGVAGPRGAAPRAPIGRPRWSCGRASDGYTNDVWVYDTRADAVGRVNASAAGQGDLLACAGDAMPMDCYEPWTAAAGAELYLAGGECAPRAVNGEPQKHYPKLALAAALRAL